MKDHDLVLREIALQSKDVPLSFEGAETDAYEPRVFWSPDSKKLVALRTAKGDDRKVYLIESSPERPAPAQARTRTTTSSPATGSRSPKPHLFDVAARKEIPVDDDLFPNPWSIDEVRWSPDSSRFTFLYNQRGHQVLRVVAVDADDRRGDARSSTSRARRSSTTRSKLFLQYLDETGRDHLDVGARRLEPPLPRSTRRRARSRTRSRRGEWVVRGVDRVDEEKRQVWFRAGGIHPGQDPYYVHYARVNFDGTGLVVLTEGDGTHAGRVLARPPVPHRHLLARRPAAGHRAAPRRRTASSSASWSGPTRRPCWRPAGRPPSGSSPRGATARPTSTA